MDLFGGADHGVGRADLEATTAANAQVFGDGRQLRSGVDQRSEVQVDAEPGASAEASALPPGGQAATLTEPSAMARAAAGQPAIPHWPQLDPGIIASISSISGSPSTANLRAATPRPMPSAAPSKVRLKMAAIITRSYLKFRPEKPMNASDIRLARTKAIGGPEKAAGTRASARRSRIPAKITMASVKPSAEPKS